MKDELSDLLSRLVDFSPVTSEQANVKRLLEFCAERFALDDMQITKNNGIHMLTAATRRTKRPRLLLAAHADVVPADEHMRTVKKEGQKLIGRGVKDMLFAVAGYIWLLNDLRDQLHMLDIGIVLNGDEEVGGGNTMPHLLENGWKPSAVWLPDSGNYIDELVVREKGVYNFDITVHGQAHHGSRPWEGDNAAHKLLRLLNDVDTLFGKSSPTHSTYSITGLRAGEATNQGPALATARLDIRYTDEDALKRYVDWLSEACQRYDAEISDLVHAPSHNVDIKSSAIQEYLAVHKSVTNRETVLITANGSSDARYFGEQGIPVIMASPLGGGLHGNDEWIDVDAFVEYCMVMREYVLKMATAS